MVCETENEPLSKSPVWVWPPVSLAVISLTLPSVVSIVVPTGTVACESNDTTVLAPGNSMRTVPETGAMPLALLDLTLFGKLSERGTDD